MAENAQYKSMNEQLRKEMTHLQCQNELAHLKEQLAWLTRQLFGQRSEKLVDGLNENQLLLPGFQPPKEPEKKKKTIPAHERRQPQRSGKDKITLPPDLPITRSIN